VQLGLHDEMDNHFVTPDGIPETERDTDCVVPETRPTLTVYDTDCPAVTLPPLPTETEKSKPAGAALTVSVIDTV